MSVIPQYHTVLNRLFLSFRAHAVMHFCLLLRSQSCTVQVVLRGLVYTHAKRFLLVDVLRGGHIAYAHSKFMSSISWPIVFAVDMSVTSVTSVT